MVLAAPPADPRRVAADLITQAEHGPDSPAILVTTDAAFADAVEAAVAAQLARRAAPRHPRRRAPRPRPDRPRPDARRRHRLRQRLRPRAPLGRRRAARADRRAAAQRGLAVRRPVGARSRPATTRPAPTTSCRPAAWPARRAACRSRRTASSSRSSGSTATGSPRIRDTIATLAEAEGLLAHRDAVEIRFEDPSPMSPTPVTFTSPTAPSTYSWEATDEEVAARYGARPGDDRPVRPQHLAHPAGARRAAAGGRPVRGAAVRVPADRLPPAGRGGGRPLRRRHRRDPRRGRRGRDPRHRRQGLHPGRRPGRRARSRPTRCTGSSPSSAAPTVVAVPRLRRGRRAGRSTRDADARRRRRTPRSSGCAARTTRPRWPSPTARSRRSSRASPRTPPRPAGPPPIVVLDEAYAEFVGTTLIGLRDDVPEPDRRPHREQGLRPGRAAGRVRRRPARADRPAQPVPSARLGVDGVGHARDRGAARSRRSSTTTSPASSRERDPPARRAASRRAGRSGRR